MAPSTALIINTDWQCCLHIYRQFEIVNFQVAQVVYNITLLTPAHNCTQMLSIINTQSGLQFLLDVYDVWLGSITTMQNFARMAFYELFNYVI